MLQQNWGLVVAAGLTLAVVLVVVTVLIRRSSAGQLRQTVRGLQAAAREREKAAKRVEKSEQKLRSLVEKSAGVKPRLIDEARGAHEDAKALARIANDQWMIAANHVRRVILDEFPPRRHERLRKRYLPEDGPEGPPSSP